MKRASYSEVRPSIQMGDSLFCSGTAVISKGIELVTRSPFSHVAPVYRPCTASDDRVWLIESTETQVNGSRFTGVTKSLASERVAEYSKEGGRVVLCQVRPELRALADWSAYQKLADLLDGKPYDYHQMLRMVFEPFVRLPGFGELLTNHEQLNSEYCSEEDTLLKKAAHVITLLSINASETSPSDAFRFDIYSEPIQLCGTDLNGDYGFGTVRALA